MLCVVLPFKYNLLFLDFNVCQGVDSVEHYEMEYIVLKGHSLWPKIRIGTNHLPAELLTIDLVCDC